MADQVTGANRFLKIDTPLGANKLLVRSISGTEGISELFNYQVSLISEDASIKFDDIMGKNVTLSIQLGDGVTERFFNGFVSRFAQLPSEGRFALYEMEIVPALWFLNRQSDCLIFQNETVPEILRLVFLRHGFTDFEIQVQREYRVWEYCVQYRESACRFAMRLMEQEGIFFFFRHDEGKHTMVIADSVAAYQACPFQSSLRFVPSFGLVLDRVEDVITTWRNEQEIRAGSYSLNDYNFQTPSTSLLVTEKSKIKQRGFTAIEVYDYPGEYDSRSEGENYVRVRMEEEEIPHAVVSGSSDCRSFASGFSFKLQEFEKTEPGRSDQNGSYVLTKVIHNAFQGGFFADVVNAEYSNSFICIRSDVPYRPPRVTPRPLVQGSQTAIVVGPPNEEIFTDKFGRVKVQFYWDREGKTDDNSSCFIRVSQPWAGKNFGGMWIPRIGQEVIVDFLEGDPDQPIITGRVYNAEQMPPYELPANQTQSGFKSRSSRTGTTTNFNEIRFEDKKGHEDLLIHAERTMHTSVESSQYITVGGSRHITTGGVDKDGNKQGDVKELVFKNHNLHVKTDDRIKIEGESHLHVQGNADATYDGDLVLGITGKCVILADTIQFQGTTKIVLMAGSSSIVIDARGVTVLGSPLINLNSPGAPPTPEIIPLVVDPDDP
jgi:type VI secretion system secreted protein VgrG